MSRFKQSSLALVLGLCALQGTGWARGPEQQVVELFYCNWTGGGGCFYAFFYAEQVEVVASYGQLDVFPGGSWGYSGCPDCMRMIEEPGPAPEPIGGGGGACAVPTNFTYGAGTDVGNGTLHFDYSWESSSGNLGDLVGCDVGERVWGYSDLPFPSPSFPAGLSPPDPTELNVPASDGAAQDNHSTPGTFVQPYNWHSVSVSQIYRYRCPCNDNNAWVTMSGPLAIERMVQLNSQTSKWRFLIRKSHPGEAKIDPLPNQ